MRSKKWVYLLTGLMPPTKVFYPHTEPVLAESIEEINIQNIGIRLKRVFLAEKDRIRKIHIEYEYKDRFVFYINDGIRDDNLAQSFADAVTSSLALLADLATEETPTAIVIPEDSVKKGRIIRIQDILGSERTGTELYFRVMHCVGVSSDVLEEVWRIVPVIMKSKSLMDAAYFYRESITQVWVAQDDVLDMIYNNSDIPTSMAERARIETAYQNAYKAIEAIIGEPPKDERKLRAKLLQAGINPDEKVGYELYGMRPGKETVLEKLINMQQTRDKKVAHGKTSTERVIGYCELKDKQELARYALLTYINSIISDKNYVN